ncbi:phospholipid scramblase 2-like [Hyposmocoma kahamanoa]|uniref:phospholipid scramblase 2-like n=1 Tax=Hyposmocoma kahamanoa TaxID=1477025 RepID=UPI000E6D7674|nr:phospholipid scramblase 2-like [Hyposmocoma kahamanoa]
MAERPGPEPPLGLSQLSDLDGVSIRQKINDFTGNKYVVLSPTGDVVMYAREDTGAIGQILGGHSRPFHIDIFDTQDRKVFNLRRPYTFGPDKMEVFVCGQLASVVRQEMTFLKPVLNINDAGDKAVLRVKGPVSMTGVCDFDVLNLDKKKVGVISKRWCGLRDLNSNDDFFQIRFPAQLDVKYKTAVIGTCFLIDFLYYEN